uniref:RQC domain-containing protein n=1 Tax=Ditylenchus dipsaci TaxID=166011 RepID=A0A915CWV0_9BILA
MHQVPSSRSVEFNGKEYKPKPRVPFGNYRFVPIDLNARAPKLNCCGGGPHKLSSENEKKETSGAYSCANMPTVSSKESSKLLPSDSPIARPAATKSTRRPNDVRDEISLVSPLQKPVISSNSNAVRQEQVSGGTRASLGGVSFSTCVKAMVSSYEKSSGTKSVPELKQPAHQSALRGIGVDSTDKPSNQRRQQSAKNIAQKTIPKIYSITDSFDDPAIDEDLQQQCDSDFNSKPIITSINGSEGERKVKNDSVDESSSTPQVIDKYQYYGMGIGNKRKSTGEITNLPQKYTLDMQKEAVLVVGSIATMGEQSMNYLVELYRGKLSQNKIESAQAKGHVKLPMFGLGVILSANDIKRFFQALVDKGLLKQRIQVDRPPYQHIYLDVTLKGKAFVTSSCKVARQSQNKVVLPVDRESARRTQTNKEKSVVLLATLLQMRVVSILVLICVIVVIFSLLSVIVAFG